MFEFKLPDLGEGVHEGQVVNVLVKEGETIGPSTSRMLEIETDKAAVEIPAPKGGVVAKIHVEPGQVVKVGQVLSRSTTRQRRAPRATAGARSRPAGEKSPSCRARRRQARQFSRRRRRPTRVLPPRRPVTASRRRHAGEGPVAAAPAVRKLARELNVDIDRGTRQRS